MDDAVAEGKQGGEPDGPETLQGGVEAVVMVMMLGELLVVTELLRRAKTDAGLTLNVGSSGQWPQGGWRETSGNLIKPKEKLVWRRLEGRSLSSVLSYRGSEDICPDIPREVYYPQHCHGENQISRAAFSKTLEWDPGPLCVVPGSCTECPRF